MTAAVPVIAEPVLRPAGVLHTWWPLAASWLLMGVEMPMVAAAVSRLADPEVNLAALGGIVFPLALVIEAPIIMMLAASTALSRDMYSLTRLKRFMMQLSFGLTVVHTVVVATPLFDVIAAGAIGAPPEIIGPARVGYAIMIPWTWAIADRRFHQGVLIRLGQQRQVGIGTAVRLVGSVGVLAAGLLLGSVPGIVIAASALVVGVFVEMGYARWCLATVGMDVIESAPAPAEPLTTGRLLRFYVPLALTPLIALLSMPIGAAGMSRMPMPLASLAVWPVLNGLAFMMRSGGVAYNEVVVRHAGDPDAPRTLGRMAWMLGGTASLLVALIAATPLATWWFESLSGLDTGLSDLGRSALWWAAVLPLNSFLHSYYQGLLVHAHRTRGITEAVAVFLVVTTIALVAGVHFAVLPGASAAMAALAMGSTAQTVWLWRRCAMVVAHSDD